MELSNDHPAIMKETCHYNELTINGESFDKKTLIKISEDILHSASRPQWEKDVYNFILQWLDKTPHLELQTSGSTGKPKKIIAEKGALVASAKMTENYFGLKRDDCALLCLPVDYIAGKMMIVRSFVSALDLHLTPPSSESLLHTEREITLAAVVPMQLEAVFAAGFDERHCLRQIRQLIVGGADISPKLRSNIITYEKQYGFCCHLSYGMTETYSHVALQRISSDNEQAHFTALKNVSFGIDTLSRLIINAPHLGIDNLLTNDVVNLLSTTEFELLGRGDNVINSGGVKIHPEQVELKLKELFADTSFFIHGVADPILGETVALFIESGDLDQATLDQLLRKVKEMLDPFENPKKIYPVAKFQQTKSGKIQRQKTVAQTLSCSKSSAP